MKTPIPSMLASAEIILEGSSLDTPLHHRSLADKLQSAVDKWTRDQEKGAIMGEVCTMDAAAFAAALKRLNLNVSDAARTLSIGRTSVQRYLYGRLPVPPRVAKMLLLLIRQKP